MLTTRYMPLFLAASIFLISAPTFSAIAEYPAGAADQATRIISKMSDLSDVPQQHWAYEAIQNVMEYLHFMEPRSASQFMGDAFATRYEIAQIFYNASKHLELLSGKDLRAFSPPRTMAFIDLTPANQQVVDSIVNEYGIMEGMPGKRFMGEQATTRYEMAVELSHYLRLLEDKIDKQPTLANRNRSSQMTDLSDSHWAHAAVKNIVDSYQLMDGYPDYTFRGGQKLTRYEVAAVLKKFVDYVNAHLIELYPSAIPTVIPTPEPTPMPTALPTPMPTPTPKLPLNTWDIKAGGSLRLTSITAADFPDPAAPFGPSTALLGGPNLDVDVWFPKLGDIRLGLGVRGEYAFYPGNRFQINSDPLQLLNSLEAGTTLNWRILGADSREDFSLVLGLGYDYLGVLGQTRDQTSSGATQLSPYFYNNHGLKTKLSAEWPLGSGVSLFAEDSFVYFPVQGSPGENVIWKNDAFAGITLPAYSLFSVQLGYFDSRYMLSGRSQVFGNMGVGSNLRVRF